MRTPALALAVFVAALAGAAGPSAAPTKGPAPPRTLLAFAWETFALTRVDPLTLRAEGRTLSTVSPTSYAFSPDGAHAVLAGDFAAPLELVDVRGMRRIGRFPSFGRSAWVDSLIWGGARRIVAIVRGEVTRAVALDPATRRVASEVRLAGAVVASAHSRSAVAVLVGPQSGIGPSRLHLVDALGRVRTVSLSRVRSGWTADRNGNGTRLQPGLALDPAGRRAVVIQPSGPAAEVDVATLEVAYHRLSRARSLAARLHDWLEPQAHAKSVVGPELWAEWVGESGIAVASWEHDGIRARDGEHRELVRARGVFLVDTLRWTRRTLSETASGVEAVGDTVLVFAGPFAAGQPFGADEGRPPRGLDAYGSDGRRRIRLLGGRAVGAVQPAGAYAYVRVSGRAFDVVDARSGRVLGRAQAERELALLPRD
jgi:hypothetical protein